MFEILLLELITVVSFLFSIVLLFFAIAPVNEMYVLFLWAVAASLVVAYARTKGRIFELTGLLLLAPLLFYDNSAAVFILFTSLTMYLYIWISLGRGGHADYVSNLKKYLAAYLIAAIVRSYLETLSGSLTISLPYIMFFLLASIVLIRSVRHLDSGMEVKRLRSTNLKYIAMLATVMLVTTVEQVREYMWIGVGFLYGIILLPARLLVKLIEIIFELLYLLRRDRPGSWDDRPQLPGDIWGDGDAPGAGEEELMYIDFSILEKIIAVLLIIVILYALYSILRKRGRALYSSVKYTEEREFIKEVRKRRRTRGRYPSNLREQIRFYYRRYLGKLKRADVGIARSDTSQDVNAKAASVFETGIERIRDIYIQARYSNKDVDRQDVEEMESLFKQLK